MVVNIIAYLLVLGKMSNVESDIRDQVRKLSVFNMFFKSHLLKNTFLEFYI